jgi:hypothetical protein
MDRKYANNVHIWAYDAFTQRPASSAHKARGAILSQSSGSRLPMQLRYLRLFYQRLQRRDKLGHHTKAHRI